jgi:predicted flavoprotein YhiN
LERRLHSRTQIGLKEAAIRFWRLSTAAAALVEEIAAPKTINDWIAATKACRIRLKKPRPIEEAISSGGGVSWDELDENLMLRRLPGVFCAGEMIDWEAPTGGYLLQGCFVTGTIAGEGVAKWIAKAYQP